MEQKGKNSRRKFVKDSLQRLPIILLSPSLISSSCNKVSDAEPTGKKVIIIGAGISGLAAAKKLKEEGFEVVVLEAQEKIGGRLRTNRSLGVAFDEGASWIHGTSRNPITKLAKQSKMNTAFTDDESLVCYDIGGRQISDAEFSKAEKEFNKILSSLYKKGSSDKSFETVFYEHHPDVRNNRLWKFMLSAFITFDLGDLDKISSTLYNEGEEFGGDERISTNGYDLIPRYLATGIDVRLNQRVTKIDYSGRKVKVQYNNQSMEGDYVLVTVPLGVLKSGNITFEPALPSGKIEAIKGVGMNCVNKFLLVWNKAFWDDEQYICYTPEIKDKFNYFVNVKKFHPDTNALMTFAYADYARQTEIMSDQQIIDEIMEHLKDIYGKDIPKPTSMLRTKWQSNENAFGSYSYTTVDTKMSHFAMLAEEIDDKLFFGGEHTNTDYFSTAHGAYLSGIREADKIINLL